MVTWEGIMIRIGVVGLQSSHTVAFKNIINSGNIGQVTKTVDTKMFESIDDVDVVIITERDGELHKNIALYFLERNIPVWVDKPFACSITQI